MHLRAASVLFSTIAVIVVGDVVCAETNHSAGSNYFGLAGFSQAEVRSRTAKNDTSGYLADARLGYAVFNHIYLGALYDLDVEKVKTSGYPVDASNKTIDYSRVSYGPSVAFISPHFFSVITYHYSSQWTVKTTSGGETTKVIYSGVGMQLDVGFQWAVGSIWIGPQVSYKQFLYTKLKNEDGSTEVIAPNLKDSKVEPTLAVWTYF